MRPLLPLAVTALMSVCLAPAFAQLAPTAPIPTTSHRVTGADYPLKSLLLHEQGTVKLRYVVRTDGSVGGVDVLTSSGSRGLDEAANYLVKRWRFAPATQNGIPVATELTANVVFAQPSTGGNPATPVPSTAHAPSAPKPSNEAFRLTGYAPDAKDYPAASLAANETGAVTLSYRIREDGRVDDTAIVTSSGYMGLDNAAAAILRDKWRFRPALENGRKVESRAASTIVFAIEPSRLKIRVLPTDPALRGAASPPRFSGGGPELDADTVGYPVATRVDESDTQYVIAHVTPPDARTLSLDLLVSPGAQISEVRLARSSGDTALDELAKLLASRLPVKPGDRDGRPAPSWARLEMTLSPGP